MRKSILSKAILIMAVMIISSIWNQSVFSQDKKEEKISIEITELEKAIHLLENPEEAKKMAGQLKALLQAKKQLVEEKKETETTEEIFPDLLELYESYETRTFSAFKKFSSSVKKAPLLFHELQDYLTQKKNFRQLLSIGLRFAIAFLAGLITWLGLRRYTQKLEDKLKWQEPLRLPQRIGRIFIAAFFKVYPWIGIYIYGYLFFLLFPAPMNTESIILRGLLALLLYFSAKNLAYFTLSPEISESRIFHLKNELSAYIFIWTRRVLLFSLWMYLLYMPSSILNWPALSATFFAFYKIGLVIMAAIILAQWKESLEKTLSFTFQEKDPRWKSNFKKASNYLAGKIYLIVTFYIAILVAFSISSFSQTYSSLLSSTAKSVLVILAAGVVWLLWTFLFGKLFQVSNTIKEKYPELEEQVNRYVNYLGKAGYFIIILLAILTVIEVWGVDVYAFLASNLSWAKAMIRIPFIILFAVIFIQMANFLIRKFANRAKIRILATSVITPMEVEKRVSTLGNIFKRAVTVIAVIFATIMILAEFGFDIMPILAGAGIVGLAVGFGAQNLVRDIISGLFFIFENRIRVGDVAIINGTGGLVEQVNLRTAVLRGLDGTIHVFPNGEIKTLSNMTYEYSYYLFDVGVAYKEDTDRVIAVLKEIGEKIMQEEEYKSAILEPIEILGVDKFGDSAVVIKARIKTLPIKQWFIGREMNRRIKKRFDESGIEIPFPHRSLYFGEASKSISVKLEGLKEQREEIKNLVREVLKESH